MRNKKFLKAVFSAFMCSAMALSAFTAGACRTDNPSDGDQTQTQPETPGGTTTPETPGGTTTPETKQLAVTFDSDGGSAVENKTVKEGEKVAAPAAPTREHYDFLGWYNGETLYNFDAAVTADLALKAKWKLHEYVVTFMADDIVFDKQYVAYGSKAHAIETDPAKPGYTFDKWLNASDADYDFDAAISADTTVKASWTAKSYDSYTVEFVTNGGSEVVAQNVTAGGTAQEPTAPTKENFTFAGWYKDAALTEEFDFGTKIKKASVLYAKWTLDGNVEAVAVDTTYSFNSGDATTGENYYVLTADDGVQGDVKTFHGLSLDATTGKITSNGSQWFQFNTSSVISFYVKAGAKVEITTHQNALTYSVNGVEATGSVYEFNADEKVSITANANMYIGYIKVTYPAALEPVADGTEIIFGSAGNYKTLDNVSVTGAPRDNGSDNSQLGTDTVISFAISGKATVSVTAYSNAEYVHYTVGLKGGTPTEEQNGNYDFVATKAGIVEIKATDNQNYLVKISVTYDGGSDAPAIPEDCEEVPTACNVADLAAAYGTGKTGAEIVSGKFKFEKGLKFEAAGSINTQGKKVYVTLTGINSLNKLSFDVKNGASSNFTGLTVTNAAGDVLASCGNESKAFSLENLPEGVYTLTSNGGACRISNLKITEVLEQGSPSSMTVKALNTDFLMGGKFTSVGVTANVVYGNGATKPQTGYTVDASSVNMNRAGEYIVRVFYTELDETVTATYSVYVYALTGIKYETFTTSSKTQKNLPLVYVVGGQFSTSGLSVTAVGSDGVKTKDFIMSADEYTVSTPDLTSAGEKTVTITAKANTQVTASYKINVVEKAAVNENTVTVAVNRANAVSSTNFHTITDALTYLGNYEAGVNKVVNIADGEYFEKVYVDLPNVQLVGSSTAAPDGEHDNGVVICFDAMAGKTTPGSVSKFGTDGSGSVSVTKNASNFVAKNITFKNYYNTVGLYLESKKIDDDTQAVALYVGSSSAAFYNCKMSGYHDTLYTNVGNHYYKNCWIEGRTDFIFGSDARAYFDDCTIYTVSAGDQDGNGGYVVALKPSSSSYYFVFNGCDFKGPETGATDIALGRAWGAEMKMVIMNSTISANYSKAPHTATTTKKNRYCTMSGNEPKPANMLEYNNTGDGAITASIENTCTVIDGTAAAAYEKDKIATILGFTPAG